MMAQRRAVRHERYKKITNKVQVLCLLNLQLILLSEYFLFFLVLKDID